MLSFELKKSVNGEAPDELEIYCDGAGIESLLAQLLLIKEGRTEHVHLIAESWGGTHLDDLPQDASNVPLRHVKILFRSSQECD